jgi:predicted phage baseplate assembly protein
VFTLDPESGEITFGDGAHGTRPTQRIVASYAFGGGKSGNVGIGAINRSPQLPAGYQVTNPIRTWGGDDAPDTASAEKGIARYVQHRDRLVSVQDFVAITRQTPGIDLGRVTVLPLFQPRYPDPADPTGSVIGPTPNYPGAITVMVIPAHPAVTSYPQPDQFFLEAVCQHLQPRRLVTTDLYIRGPEYVDIWISVGLDVLGGYAAGPVREAVKQALYRFLSPLYGGQPLKGSEQGAGWPLDTTVFQGELAAVVTRVEGVRQLDKVRSLLLGTATTDEVPEVPLAGLELPRLAGVSVVSGPAIALDQLRQARSAAGTGADGAEWTPIPVLPERC